MLCIASHSSLFIGGYFEIRSLHSACVWENRPGNPTSCFPFFPLTLAWRYKFLLPGNWTILAEHATSSRVGSRDWGMMTRRSWECSLSPLTMLYASIRYNKGTRQNVCTSGCCYRPFSDWILLHFVHIEAVRHDQNSIQFSHVIWEV